MDDKKICSQYVVGLCLKDAFRIRNTTAECNLHHDKKLQLEYSSAPYKYIEHTRIALHSYQKVLKELAHKISQNKHLLSVNMIDEEYIKHINAAEYIENKLQSSFDKIHINSIVKALEIYGQIILSCETHLESCGNQILVCQNCSAFYRKGEMCIHGFCDTYKKIKKIGNSLAKLVGKEEKSTK